MHVKQHSLALSSLNLLIALAYTNENALAGRRLKRGSGQQEHCVFAPLMWDECLRDDSMKICVMLRLGATLFRASLPNRCLDWLLELEVRSVNAAVI